MGQSTTEYMRLEDTLLAQGKFVNIDRFRAQGKLPDYLARPAPKQKKRLFAP